MANLDTELKGFVERHIFILAFAFILLSIAASNVKLSALWGASGQTFTLFEFLGPLPAAFLGPMVGVLVILAAKIGATIYSGAPLDMITLLRFIPVLFGAYFFATYKNAGNSKILQVAVPLLCVALFVLHPVGRQAWVFSLFWLIPPAVVLFAPGHLLLRSLGTTLSQHAVGGVIWMYFVNPLSPEAWMALIPVVVVERSVFAIGIALSYIGSLKTLHVIRNFMKARAPAAHPAPHHPRKNRR